jgi:hypothetical protein
VRRIQERKAPIALATMEYVLASLARIPERDHALDALVAAIETDRNRLRARMTRPRRAA